MFVFVLLVIWNGYGDFEEEEEEIFCHENYVVHTAYAKQISNLFQILIFLKTSFSLV